MESIRKAVVDLNVHHHNIIISLDAIKEGISKDNKIKLLNDIHSASDEIIDIASEIMKLVDNEINDLI